MHVFSCCVPYFDNCLECIQGPSFSATASYSQLSVPLTPSNRLDVTKSDVYVENTEMLLRFAARFFEGQRKGLRRIGKDVVILKEGERICGTGGALGTLPIVQNKAYFQVNIQQNGAFGIGLGNSHAPLDTVPVSSNFWGIRDNGDVVANDTVIAKLTKPVSEGDCIGVCFDHVELKFLLNGEPLEPSITGVKGPAYPLVYVDDSAILDVKFRKFTEKPPAGYSEILAEQTLL